MKRALFLTAALITAPCAYAQEYTLDQYQAGDVSAHTNVDVGRARDVGATAVAAGTVANGIHNDHDVYVDNTQHMDGDASATVVATVWHARGAIALNATAMGNGGTSEAYGVNQDIRSAQLAHGDVDATVRFTGGDAGDAGASATASGNVGALNQEDGQTRFIGAQESTGSIRAAVEADHCCVSGQVISGAIASANNLSFGGDTATILTDTRQTASGDVSARVDLYAGYATDASGNATANANAVTIDNQWGYVNARVAQSSSAAVRADSFVTLGGDFTGFGSAGAYGVGNQALISNVGSDTVIDTAQDNSGDISANAAFSGEGGVSALASSAAYGNYVNASLCAYCDENVPSMTASNTQTNSGDVRSTATVASQSAGTIAATSTAIGNAATYQTRGPGG